MNDASKATTDVNFALYVPDATTLPKDLGDAKIYLSPAGSPPDVPAAYFVYSSDSYGIVWLGESSPDAPDADQRMAYYVEASSPENVPKGAQAEIVSIRDGVPALLRVSAEGVATIEWVENETQFTILGSTITRSQILEICNSA